MFCKNTKQILQYIMALCYSFGLQEKPNYVDYLWFEKLFTAEEVERILALWNKDYAEKASLSGNESDIYEDSIRKSSVIMLPPADETMWIYQKLSDAVLQANAERYGFDLVGYNDYLQLTQYAEGEFFDWHLDFGTKAVSTRKLSITIQLSDESEYEGGELQFMTNNKTVAAPKTKGTAIMFPSFIMHRVTPITKGARHSIVGWASGPSYR